MDRDLSIVTQVAFKATAELESELDLTTQEGQARWEAVFSFLTESLLGAINSHDSASQQAANLIHANFPGTTNVTDGYVNGQPRDQQLPLPQPQAVGGPVQVKGAQHGPLPDWLFIQASEKGVSEVYDNRDRAMGTKRPWFRATVGGENAPAFWPPR